MRKIFFLINFFWMIFLILIILYFGKNILIPFVFALFLWMIIMSIVRLIDKIKFFKIYIPSWIKIIISYALIVFIFIVLFIIVYKNALSLANSYEKYLENVNSLTSTIEEKFKIDLKNEVQTVVNSFNLKEILLSFFNFSTALISNVLLIILYTIFLFFEEKFLKIKLKKIFAPGQLIEINDTIDKIEESVTKYMGIKTFVSLLTGLLSYFVMVIMKVDFAVFWAFLIFIFNFVPIIGSIVATLFPAIFLILQTGFVLNGFILLLIVTAIQMFIGNFLEPKITSDYINISPIVILLSISIWGFLWGISGILLCTPLISITIIILSKFERTKAIAIFLSKDGNI